MTAIFLAMPSALANFFFIPYYPFWALVVIALDIWIIWALDAPGRDPDLKTPARRPSERGAPLHPEIPSHAGAPARRGVAQRLLRVAAERRLDDLARDLHVGEDLVHVGLADEDDDGRAARLELAPSSFMNLSSTPASLIALAAAPVAASIAMPKSGMKKMRPMSPPHRASPAAPTPARDG